ncbi:hypothetical protein [Streptomyces sp. RPT161]|uniref:hypothetical protein n=1 Tax=Streptomyces sp. RPT161 TaxID=3015993 RepID=UPI002FD2F86D
MDGTDALVYRGLRAESAGAVSDRWLAKQVDPAYRRLELLPSEMALVRSYVRMAGQLRGAGPALVDAAVEAVWDDERRRWLMQVAEAEAQEIGRVFFLEGLSGSVLARNRLARHEGIRYRAGGVATSGRREAEGDVQAGDRGLPSRASAA